MFNTSAPHTAPRSALSVVPATGSLHPEALLRARDIVGDRRAGVPGLLPIARSTWLAGVAAGRFPQPIRLGSRTTCWRARDIFELIERAAAGGLDEQLTRVGVDGEHSGESLSPAPAVAARTAARATAWAAARAAKAPITPNSPPATVRRS